MRTSKISGNFRELTLGLKSPSLVVGRIPWSRRKGTKGLAISFALPAFAQKLVAHVVQAFLEGRTLLCRLPATSI